jgi:hypothetical protein
MLCLWHVGLATRALFHYRLIVEPRGLIGMERRNHTKEVTTRETKPSIYNLFLKPPATLVPQPPAPMWRRRATPSGRLLPFLDPPSSTSPPAVAALDVAGQRSIGVAATMVTSMMTRRGDTISCWRQRPHLADVDVVS